ncbi:cytochrome P450 6B1-like [Phymastichus coffea]|uniref:cytochrome P450 6B1-like n=1 Tax=Phymastichus coffea TaxID=108790 RepID=UPI00273BD0FB|nr:cytochrome P450 6B1-like [Phymastichus coffea]
MEIGIAEVLVGFGLLSLCAYYYLTLSFNFWKEKNVQGPTPSLFCGNFKDVILGRINMCLAVKKYYDELKSEPIVGLFNFKNAPLVMVKDPDLIKDVMIKDFNVFCDRGMYVDEHDELTQHLINLPYEKWRPLRNNLSPVFTSGKLRDMFYLMAGCLDHFEKYLEQVAKTGEPTEFRDLTAKFTIDSIGACAFGINTNALDEHSEFQKHGRDLFATNISNVVRHLLREIAPKFLSLLGPFKYTKAIRFVVSSMKETMDYRKQNSIRRNDFVDLLMDLQNDPEKVKNIEFTDLFLISQALVFFAAGFETSSTTISNALYELAIQQDIQGKLRKEIRAEMEKDKGKVTYDNIKRMKYLDKVFKETLRKYPPGSVLQRKAGDTYTFSGTNVTIPKDMKVLIPVWAIHRDPQIYPDPDKFDPERFDEEFEKSRHPMNYLPFGDGPHNCIGARFANYQTKLGIIAVINKFKVDVCEKTCIPYVISARSIVPTPVNGIYLNLSKISN